VGGGAIKGGEEGVVSSRGCIVYRREQFTKLCSKG